MAQSEEPVIPGLIGNFNIPKAVIENKVDVLAFLEILVRKGVVSAQELDEIRAAVVAHLNAIYPELDLQYATPESMGQQAGLGGSALPPAQNANPVGSGGMASAAFQPTSQPKAAASFKPTAAAQAFIAEDAQQAKTGQAQNIPAGSVDQAASSVAPPAEKPAAPPAQSPNAPLYVSAPPPKFIK